MGCSKSAFGEKKNVAVRTPTAVAAIRGTTYRAKSGSEESSVLVYEGKVDVNAKNVIDARKNKCSREVSLKEGPLQNLS